MDYAAVAIRFGRIARHLVIRDDKEKDCHPQPNIDLCEKPATSDKTTPITIGVIAGIIVVGLAVVITFLHFRRKRRDEKEWPKNNQELEDYGFIDPSSTVRQPQSAHHNPQAQQQQQQRDQYQHYDDSPDRGGFNKPPRNDLDDLERSLRGGGQTTGAFRRQNEQVSGDMKPVEPTDRI
ncbi:hypothetical protein F5B22DRAFT_225308 [Xylaria bambusicola]|uniref:uncharacterized protein n=1 Tax=Xylaria bambusicola TaxID=326684 RepID=UPI0020083504|nr:uncharacterized protein F5B22DRAFT_225308 [Xylaria bambusicola]KAI0514624.1 hypothetical protein F5B22DRAFT_225308 [Xylaria bambusicola]